MNASLLDVQVLVYNYGVLLSAVVTVRTFDFGTQWALFGFALVLAVVWTLYFKFVFVEKLTSRMDEPENTA